MLQSIDYHAILPELILGGTAILVLLVDLFLPANRKWLGMPLSFLGVLGSLAATLTLIEGESRGTFCIGPDSSQCSFVVDDFALLFKVVFLASALVILLLSLNYFEEGRYYQGEYYFLLLCSFFGMLTIASSRDLIMLFISLEIVSVPGFVIAGFRKTDTRSSESAIKFFLIGVLATSVMLFGMSLIYGLTGSVHVEEIARSFAANDVNSELPATFAAIALVIVGFAFKVSAAPFHFWAPDTYQGAPVPVAAFLSVASKAAGFTGLMTVCYVAFEDFSRVWAPIFAVLAVLTMTLGNLVAMQQRHMVRLLAYSSVAQAGYMLVPLAVAASAGQSAFDDAFAATLSYISIYAVMNLGVFACVIAVARRTPRNLVADYRGLVKSSPVLACVFAFFLFCLAGAPPGLAGLFAKLQVFRATIDGDIAWLGAVMAVNTVFAMYYYLRVAFGLFAGIGQEGEAPLEPVRIPAPILAAIGITTVAALAIGFYPELVLSITPDAVLDGAIGG